MNAVSRNLEDYDTIRHAIVDSPFFKNVIHPQMRKDHDTYCHAIKCYNDIRGHLSKHVYAFAESLTYPCADLDDLIDILKGEMRNEYTKYILSWKK